MIYAPDFFKPISIVNSKAPKFVNSDKTSTLDSKPGTLSYVDINSF